MSLWMMKHDVQHHSSQWVASDLWPFLLFLLLWLIVLEWLV
jgi:hypothetical protein